MQNPNLKFKCSTMFVLTSQKIYIVNTPFYGEVNKIILYYIIFPQVKGN